MSMTISQYDYQKYGADGYMKPIIFCATDKEMVKNAVPLDVRIAKILAGVKPAQRSICLPKIFDKIIEEFPENTVFKDFDVLFSPEFQIDILPFLISACRKRKFSVIWPGKYSDGKLVYAEPGYPEFQKFDLAYCDVTCVIS